MWIIQFNLKGDFKKILPNVLKMLRVVERLEVLFKHRNNVDQNRLPAIKLLKSKK